jgi:biotin carboxylase
MRPVRTLRDISEIRSFFRTNTTPVYFVSPSAFNLLGIDRWLQNFFYVNYFDSFDGNHPRVFVPRERPARDFESMEEINNYLLAHKEVIDWIKARGSSGKATLVMADSETDALAGELGLEIIHPPVDLRRRLDSKIVTTKLGNEAGVPSVPNTLGRAGSYDDLMRLAAEAGLGMDLVVQTPYGDSGRTTFFIRGRDDWDRNAKDMLDEQLKVMRRINCRCAAVEAVLTRHGTLVGPLMTDLIGYSELTPYAGGWCGNDMYSDVLSPQHRARARELIQRFGRRLAREGYRGFFEVDVLADADSGELYLGELNPRLSGVTSLTNVTASAYGDLPLFLFHLLEYMDVDYDLDVDELNARWARAESVDAWSQIVIKETDDVVELIREAPRTGVWRLDGPGRATFRRWADDWHSLVDETEAFYLRVAQPGDYRYKGADLGILVTRGRMQSGDHQLSARATRWIEAIRNEFTGTPSDSPPAVAPPSVPLKMGHA